MQTLYEHTEDTLQQVFRRAVIIQTEKKRVSFFFKVAANTKTSTTYLTTKTKQSATILNKLYFSDTSSTTDNITIDDLLVQTENKSFVFTQNNLQTKQR